jgi:hypothetical protein
MYSGMNGAVEVEGGRVGLSWMRRQVLRREMWIEGVEEDMVMSRGVSEEVAGEWV